MLRDSLVVESLLLDLVVEASCFFVWKIMQMKKHANEMKKWMTANGQMETTRTLRIIPMKIPSMLDPATTGRLSTAVLCCVLKR